MGDKRILDAKEIEAIKFMFLLWLEFIEKFIYMLFERHWLSYVISLNTDCNYIAKNEHTCRQYIYIINYAVIERDTFLKYYQICF